MTRIPQKTIAGLDRPVSALILGCDNKDSYDEGAAVWDHWLERGGTGFDTAFVYGGGRHEAALGEWMARRGLAGQLPIVVKGAHTPHCTPEAIGVQLAQSLERLRLDRAPIYIMHRDNPDVPVGEFVEALHALKSRGLIGVFGGSNWSVARFSEAQAYARGKGLAAPSILNNNLALAVMEKPVWPGCISSNNTDSLAFLRETGTAHFSWSSQARGYFLPEVLRHRLPPDTAPETCFGSAANSERRKRAEALALEMATTAHAIGLAWVLAQRFPSFALVGPRSVAEIDSTLAALAVQLTPQKIGWLNLETDF